MLYSESIIAKAASMKLRSSTIKFMTPRILAFGMTGCSGAGENRTGSLFFGVAIQPNL